MAISHALFAPFRRLHACQREVGGGHEGSLYQRNLRKVNEVACKCGEEGAGRVLAMKTVIDI